LARRRFFVDRIHGNHSQLEGDDARHLARVLRAEPGQRYEISDNRNVYLAEISEVAPGRITFLILESLAPVPSIVEITLFAALFKFDRYEWMIEKTTELGVAKIVPVNAAHSEKGLKAAAAKRIERWRKIARESSQQARRDRMPEIATPVDLAAALSGPRPYRYFLEEQPGAPPLLSALPDARNVTDTVAILIGPEGGWTDPERDAATAAGWKPVSLGSNVLRAETAATAALAILSQAWLSAGAHPLLKPPREAD
jgi:16S rRNA (uracil1498-N3)-methyltransferase